MDQRRVYLKQLAVRSARAWSAVPVAPAFAGETRIETRNTVYALRDGVCYEVTRREAAAGASRTNPSAFAGMRLVGWLMRSDPHAGVSYDYRPGCYAVLWRPRGDGSDRSAVALTSTTTAFRVVARSVVPPLPKPMAALQRPPTPLPPTPPSMTRLHPSDVPPAPATPTPPRRTASAPPPQPARAAAAGIRPLPPRAPMPLSPQSDTRLMG